MALAERLQTIRAIGLNVDVGRQVHQPLLVRLAREGARYSPQFLQRFSPERRYATLVAFLLETSASLTDEPIEFHNRLIGQYRRRPLTLLLIRDLLFGKARYSDFVASAEQTPTNILADRLKRLEREGLISRVPYSQRPLRVE